jgi:hypothetical protein
MRGRHGASVPIVARPSGPNADPPSTSDRTATAAPALLPGALLPSGEAPTIAPVPAPHRALALDALAIVRTFRDHPRDAGPWGEPAFAREVDRVRRQLAPIASRRALASSYAREAFRTVAGTGTGNGRRAPLLADPGAIGPVRLAYAVRWLELGNGAPRPGWSGFVTDRA